MLIPASYHSFTKQIKCFLLFAILFFTVFNGDAQQQVKGKTIDEYGSPLPGVIIFEEGNNLATISDKDGNFSFSLIYSGSALKFSKTGYNPVEKFVDGEILNVALYKIRDSLYQISPVFVDNGYYTWKSVNSSTATNVYEKNDFVKSASGLDVILGGMSGVATGRSEGLPGNSFSTAVRGINTVFTNEPLYIVDGVVLNAGNQLPFFLNSLDPLLALNPEEIESVTVLKDASATAIYGSTGANGVVLVQTKKIQKQPLRFTIDGFSSLQLPYNKTKLLDAESYVGLMNESFLQAGMESQEWSRIASEDWVKKLVKPAVSSNLSFGLTGGNQVSGILLSGKFNQITGVVSGSGLKNGNLHFKGNLNPSPRIKLNTDFSFTRSIQQTPLNGYNRFNGNPLVFAQMYPPFSSASVYYIPVLSGYFGDKDPAEFLEKYNLENLQSQFYGNFGMEINLAKGLSLNTLLSGDYTDYGRNAGFFTTGSTSFLGNNEFTTYRQGNMYNWNIANTLKFQQELNGNPLLVLFGWSENYIKGKDTQTINSINTEDYVLNLPVEIEGTNSRRSGALFLQGNFSVNNKFDVAAGLRREVVLRQNGTELFGLFPSFSTGYWLVKCDESKENSALSGLKLKIGWGISGAENFGFLNYRPENGGDLSFLKSTEIYNELVLGAPEPNARWENSEEWNLGLNAGFFNNSLSLEMNYFDRLRSNVAFASEINSDGESLLQYQYTGRIHNRGWELEASYSKKIGDLGLWLSFNLQSLKNKILDLGDDFSEIAVLPNALNFNDVPFSMLQEGNELGAFYGYVKEGIFETQDEINEANSLGNQDEYYQSEFTAPGDIKFKDIDGNGVIDENDITFVGNPNPNFIYAFKTGLIFRMFDFLVQFDGSSGNEIYNLNKTWGNATGGPGNRFDEMKNYWQSVFVSNNWPRVQYNDPNQNNRPNSSMVENGSFLRIRQVDFGYTFLTKNKVNKIRFYFSAENVLYSTRYSGNYPVSVVAPGFYNFSGLDYGSYPQSATVKLGFQYNF